MPTLQISDDPAAVAVAVAELLPRLRFSDLNRLRLDVIPRVLREKAKELAAQQGLDIFTALMAAGMRPDDDGPAGAPVLLPFDGSDPTSGLPAILPLPVPTYGSGDDEEEELLEPTPLEVVEPVSAE